MRVLVACEFSGRVREAFRARGHHALSVDFEDSEIPGLHVKGDVLALLDGSWDLLVAFPPCTYLAVCANRWVDESRLAKRAEALEFVLKLAYCGIPKICIENPRSVLSSLWRKPDQCVQPWQYGHGEVKSTFLWLHGLPALKPTEIVDGRKPVVHNHVRSWKDRSRTYVGIANAMAQQWG